jgi:hypothetical protein
MFKTFDDLVFEPALGQETASLKFDNGLGVSVTVPENTRGTPQARYMLAPIDENDELGRDIPNLTTDGITRLMQTVQTANTMDDII